MEELLQKMNEFWDKHEATENDGGLYFFNMQTQEEMCEEGEVTGLMWKYLFKNNNWNWNTVTFLKKHGYQFRVFERDSFGILVAGVGKDGKWFSIA